MGVGWLPAVVREMNCGGADSGECPGCGVYMEVIGPPCTPRHGPGCPFDDEPRERETPLSFGELTSTLLAAYVDDQRSPLDEEFFLIDFF